MFAISRRLEEESWRENIERSPTVGELSPYMWEVYMLATLSRRIGRRDFSRSVMANSFIRSSLVEMIGAS